MTKYLLLVITIASMFFGLCCKDNGVAPVEQIKPGRRDYTWFVDTLQAGGNFMNSISGVSPNDVWIISIPGDYSQTFYHFDGVRWSTDGTNRPFSPWSVRAFTSNNVWSVGLQGDIWKFDGAQWKSITRVNPGGTNFYSFEDIDGDSPLNLYSVGNISYNGTDLYPLVYHFDGNTWARVNIQNILDCALNKIRFYAPNRALVLGSTHRPDGSVPDSSKIFSFDGLNLHEIYSAQENRIGKGDFVSIPNGIIVLRGPRLTYYNGSQEQDILIVTSTLFGNIIDARSTKDVFLGMLDGIAHYNGTDIQYLYNFPTANIRGTEIMIFESSVFVLAYDRDKQINIIYRGYLK